MTTDIEQRLREVVPSDPSLRTPAANLLVEAADEIAQLRKELADSREDAKELRFGRDTTDEINKSLIERITAAEAELMLVRGKTLEEAAQHFERRAKELSGDIFASMASRSQICRVVATEIRSLARSLQPGGKE